MPLRALGAALAALFFLSSPGWADGAALRAAMAAVGNGEWEAAREASSRTQ